MIPSDKTRRRIEELWLATGRKGIDELVEFLRTSDFYQAPCSTKHHLARTGGLAEHSLNVYGVLDAKVRGYRLEGLIPHDSVVVCGLGHDLCKVSYYKEEIKDGQPAYVVCNALPIGHGEKSLSVLQDFIRVTEAEKMAIRWHMSAFDVAVHFNHKETFRDAVRRTPLVPLLITADYEASTIVEAMGTGEASAERPAMRLSDGCASGLSEALDSARAAATLWAGDWSVNARLAWVYGILVGWDRASMRELQAKGVLDPENVGRLKRLRTAVAAVQETR